MKLCFWTIEESQSAHRKTIYAHLCTGRPCKLRTERFQLEFEPGTSYCGVKAPTHCTTVQLSSRLLKPKTFLLADSSPSMLILFAWAPVWGCSCWKSLWPDVMLMILVGHYEEMSDGDDLVKAELEFMNTQCTRNGLWRCRGKWEWTSLLTYWIKPFMVSCRMQSSFKNALSLLVKTVQLLNKVRTIREACRLNKTREKVFCRHHNWVTL